MEHVAQNTDNAERGVVLRKADASPTPLRIPLTDQTSNLSRGGEYGGLFEYWRIIRRRWGTVLVVSVIGAIAGILTGLPQTPVYRSRTTVEIQALNENLLNTREVNPTPASSDYYYPEADIQTQIKLLQSESLLERAVAKLKLDRDSESLEQPGRLSAWRKALGLPAPAPVSSGERALGMAAGNLKIKALPQSRIVEITCESTDPRLASDFANTLIKEFRESTMDSRLESAQLTSEWLNRQLDELRINLEKSEDRLQSYARVAGLIFFTGEKEKENVAEQKLRQLQAELSTAQADRIAKQSKYEMAKSGGSLPEVLDDTSLRDYQGKLTELRRQLAELSGPFTPAHPKVQRLQAQIAEVESALEKERANIIKRIENEQEAARRREELLSTEYTIQARLVSEQAEKAIHYSILKREVDTSRQLYEAMLQKVKEYGIASAMRASNIRVVDPARPSLSPYKPNLVQLTQSGLIVGLVLGIVFVVLREQADRSIQAPGDAPFYLKLPELGVIPAAKVDPGLRGFLKRPSVLQLNTTLEGNESEGNSRKNGGRSVELVTWNRKLSLLAESFRATLASILFSSQNGDSPRILVVTSTAPTDGKTTTVSNLGIALAEINRRVLLIDGDLRKPRLDTVFDLPNSWGLSNILHDNREIEKYTLEDLAKGTEVPGLWVLPSGSGTMSIANLLHSPRTIKLLHFLRRHFDNILIDSPPMQQISDARVLGRLSDGVILVMRAGHTTRDAAVAAAQRFGEDGTPVIGTILNGWNPKRTSSYGYYSSSHYHYYRGESHTRSANDTHS